jgi:hypothetical protein
MIEGRQQRPASDRDGPRRVHLPGFVPDEPVGLGDAVMRVTSAAGVRPCRGCVERARRLNNWMVFTGTKRWVRTPGREHG